MPRALRALLTLVVAGVLGVAGAGAAAASATGYAPIAPFSYTGDDGVTRSVPRGCMLVHSVVGTGQDLAAQIVNVDCAGFAAMRNSLFCEATASFVFTGTTGVSTRESDTLPGCRTLGIRLTNDAMPLVTPTGGRACATLFVAGISRATSCHVIG